MHSFNSARHRRNLLDLNGFTPIQFPFTNYTTDSRAKEEMKHTFGDTLFLNNLHLLPDPLKKNLADSVITGEEKKKKNMTEKKEPVTPQRADYYPSLAGITSFFSGVLNVMGAIFHKRTDSPTPHYYDCYDEYNDQQRAPSSWHGSKIEVQNKNERVQFGSNNEVNTNLEEEMNKDCRLAATHCEEKLNQVRLLLTNKNIQNVQSTKFHPRRPRKCFVEPGSVEESFEDAFSPEDFVSLGNNTYIEYCSPYNNHYEEFMEVDAPQIKTDICVQESMRKNNYSLEGSNDKETSNEKIVINDNCSVNLTEQVVSSCEDKLSQLKALLQSKHVKHDISEQEVKSNDSEISNPIPIPVCESVPVDVPNESVFGDEINSEDLANSQEDDYFNEVTGKFFSSFENEDPFQIVFSDSPRDCRRRISSDCESEDSFIVFEESPDSCFISHDIFGEDAVVDDNHTDSDSDFDDDSGITCKLAHNLSQTFGDLTDDSLYSCDVVDSVQACMPSCNDEDVKQDILEERSGLLLNNRKKLEKKKKPPKKVTFSSEPPKVHVMRVWAFAARQARAGHWERHALDRERFKRRIADVEMAISWVFKPQHRSRIVFQRFRPWWNAERRRELAEKKEKEEKEKEKELKKQEEVRELKERGNDLENVTNNSIEDNTTGDDSRDCKQTVLLAKNGYTKQQSHLIETKQAKNLNNIQNNIDSNTLANNKTGLELSEPKHILHNGYTSNEAIVQTNTTFNDANSKKFANDNENNSKIPTVNQMINFTTSDDKLAITIQDIQNNDLKIDT